MWAATWALNTLVSRGKSTDWMVHMIGQSVGAYTNATHGMTLAAVSLPYYRYILPYGVQKFKRFAVNVWDIDPAGKTDEQTAQEGLDAMEAWILDLEEMMKQNDSMSAEKFAGTMARILEKRRTMLKLLSMNIYDMEVNSRLENLVEFKKVYAVAFDAVGRCLEKFFLSMPKESIQQFLSAFFPFLFGVHPYTCHTEKQLEAMRIAGVEIAEGSIYELTEAFVFRMLKSFGQ